LIHAAIGILLGVVEVRVVGWFGVVEVDVVGDAGGVRYGTLGACRWNLIEFGWERIILRDNMLG
jgi:hypothetical protein